MFAFGSFAAGWSVMVSGARRMVAGALAVVVVAVMASCVCAGLAFAASPAWRIDALSDSTAAPGGRLDYLVQITNTGDADAEGSEESPIEATVVLPAGFKAVAAGEFGGSTGGAACTGPGGAELEGAAAVTCKLPSPIPAAAGGNNPFFSFVLKVAVDPAASDVATASFAVAGGGAVSQGTVRTVRVTSLAPVFGVDAFDARSVADAAGDPSTQAGGHPDATSSTIAYQTATSPNPLLGDLWPVEPTKDVLVDLPAGMVGNPSSLARCSASQLVNSSVVVAKPLCPPASQVGTVLLPVVNVLQYRYVLGPLPVYNMVAPPNVPAEFGFNVDGTVVTLAASVRSASDYGASVRASNIPEGVDVAGSTFTFWDVPSDPSHDGERSCPGQVSPAEGGGSCASGAPPAAFLRNPTSCTQPGEGLQWGMHMDAWTHPGALDENGEPLVGDPNWASARLVSHALPGYPYPSSEWGAPVGITGCAGVPFTPGLFAQPTSAVAGSPTGLNVSVTVPQEALSDPSSVSQADIRNVIVRLPEGMTANPSVATGLGACTPAQIDLHSAAPAGCPDASKLGTVEVKTPVLADPLEGSVYLASQNDNPFNSLLAAYLVAEGHGVVVKLAGKLEADPLTGRLTAVFKDLPQQPVESVKVDFSGGPRAALTVPSVCGNSPIASTLDGWNGASVSLTSNYQVQCPLGFGAFGPSFTAGTVNNQAGAFSPFTVSFSRQDTEQQFAGLTVKTPPGLLGILKNVTQCPEPQASQGACGEGSLIGHVTATAGAGSEPVEVQGGRAYLTGPYKGAPFGLSVAIPAKAGPFDLGTVVVRSRIDVDPHTSQITITSDPFPTILQGVPLQIRSVSVTVDRPGFIFNPTDCDALSVDGTIASTQGASAVVSSRFQAANCASLPFKPTFKVSTKATTTKKNGASLDVKVTSGPGQANLGKVAVTLPKQLPSWLPTIQQACLAAVFNANPAACPAGSDIGVASATTPVLANPVTGPVYLVSHGGAAFPDIVMVLQGEGVTVEQVGSINIKGQVTSSAFNSIPDVPINTFELSLPQGPHHALSANLPAKAKGSFCGQSLVMPTTLTGQNNAQIKQSTKISVTDCPKARKKPTRGAHGKHKKKRG